MAVEKGLVLTAIEAKFKGKSLTKNFKENLATKWADKIEGDDDIEAYIDDREDVILEASAEADRRAIAASKKAKGQAQPPKQEKVVVEEEEGKTDDTPEWAKKLMSRMESFEAGQKQKTIAEKFKSDERIKKLRVPEKILSRYVPKDEDSFDEAIKDFVSDFTDLAKSAKIDSFSNDTPGSSTSGGTEAGKVKKMSPEEALKIVNAKIS